MFWRRLGGLLCQDHVDTKLKVEYQWGSQASSGIPTATKRANLGPKLTTKGIQREPKELKGTQMGGPRHPLAFYLTPFQPQWVAMKESMVAHENTWDRGETHGSRWKTPMALRGAAMGSPWGHKEPHDGPMGLNCNPKTSLNQ